MLDILYQFLFVLLYIVLTGVLLSTMLGFPGNWVLVGAAFIIGIITGFSSLTWTSLAICAGLAVLGEVIESLLGAVIVARRGGGKWAVVGSFVGGFAGVVLGAPFFPPLGSVLLGFVGAFAGAVGGELLTNRDKDKALQIGFWSFVGRISAIAAKLTVGCVILWIIIRTTWP